MYALRVCACQLSPPRSFSLSPCVCLSVSVVLSLHPELRPYYHYYYYYYYYYCTRLLLRLYF